MKRVPVDSSMIRSIGYDPATNTLEIQFTSGLIYHYLEVEPETHEEFLSADSQGSYFLENIEHVYRYQRVR